MDAKFTLKSGAVLAVTEAPYVDASRLKNELMKSAKGLKGLDDTIVAGLGGLANMDVGPILDAILTAATSPEVEAALFKCGERALYENVRVTPALFDDPQLSTKAREDYYEIALKIIEVNCTPFMKGVLSMYGKYFEKKTSTPA